MPGSEARRQVKGPMRVGWGLSDRVQLSDDIGGKKHIFYANVGQPPSFQKIQDNIRIVLVNGLRCYLTHSLFQIVVKFLVFYCSGVLRLLKYIFLGYEMGNGVLIQGDEGRFQGYSHTFVIGKIVIGIDGCDNRPMLFVDNGNSYIIGIVTINI